MPLLPFLSRFLLFAACFGILTSTVFVGMVVVAALRFRKRSRPTPQEFTPPVSILKPLHGDEPALKENLRGFFEQDYPAFELLFCARTADDPALAIARELAAEYPTVPSQVLTCGAAPYANAKVFSLDAMEKAASHCILVVSDSDVRVTPQYLHGIMVDFSSPQVGLVTCLYRGVAVEGGLWARLEAVGMSIEMSSGVIVSQMLGPIEFALGPTMAARREAVQDIGGFSTLGPYCSDDFLLGNWIAAKGWQCRLSNHVIEHMVLNASFLESVRHQVRWMKSTRASLPKGHLGTGLTYKMPFGLLALAAACALHRPMLGVALLLWTALECCIQASVVAALVVQEKNLIAKAALFIVRDLMGFGYWLASYGSRRILWRGETFELLHEGRMRKVNG
jgi:ceramide glucosyltransferase